MGAAAPPLQHPQVAGRAACAVCAARPGCTGTSSLPVHLTSCLTPGPQVQFMTYVFGGPGKSSVLTAAPQTACTRARPCMRRWRVRTDCMVGELGHLCWHNLGGNSRPPHTLNAALRCQPEVTRTMYMQTFCPPSGLIGHRTDTVLSLSPMCAQASTRGAAWPSRTATSSSSRVSSRAQSQCHCCPHPNAIEACQMCFIQPGP